MAGDVADSLQEKRHVSLGSRESLVSQEGSMFGGLLHKAEQGERDPCALRRPSGNARPSPTDRKCTHGKRRTAPNCWRCSKKSKPATLYLFQPAQVLDDRNSRR